MILISTANSLNQRVRVPAGIVVVETGVNRGPVLSAASRYADDGDACGRGSQYLLNGSCIEKSGLTYRLRLFTISLLIPSLATYSSKIAGVLSPRSVIKPIHIGIYSICRRVLNIEGDIWSRSQLYIS